MSKCGFWLLFSEQRPQKVSHVSRSDGSVALSWQKPATAAAEAVIGYLVEWLLVDRPYKELQWQRLSRDQLSINITGVYENSLTRLMSAKIT